MQGPQKVPQKFSIVTLFPEIRLPSFTGFLERSRTSIFMISAPLTSAAFGGSGMVTGVSSMPFSSSAEPGISSR